MTATPDTALEPTARSETRGDGNVESDGKPRASADRGSRCSPRPLSATFYVANTREEARAKARPAVEAKYRGYATHGLPGVGASFTDGVDRLMDKPFVVGAPDECLEKLGQLHELGFTHVALRLFWPGMTQAEALGMIELVAVKLLPTLQSSRPDRSNADRHIPKR